MDDRAKWHAREHLKDRRLWYWIHLPKHHDLENLHQRHQFTCRIFGSNLGQFSTATSAIWQMKKSQKSRQWTSQLAATSDLRLTVPTRYRTTDGSTTRTIECSVAHSRPPLPGMLLIRRYEGQLIQVRVLADGFEYLGDRYRSLIAIAKKITGSRCSGNRLFQLTNSTGDQ